MQVGGGELVDGWGMSRWIRTSICAGRVAGHAGQTEMMGWAMVCVRAGLSAMADLQLGGAAKAGVISILPGWSAVRSGNQDKDTSSFHGTWSSHPPTLPRCRAPMNPPPHACPPAIALIRSHPPSC